MNDVLCGTSGMYSNKEKAEYMFNNKLPADKQQELDMAYSLFKQAFVSGSSKAERYARQAKNSLMLRFKEEGYGGCVAVKGIDYKGKSYYLTIDDVLASYKMGS